MWELWSSCTYKINELLLVVSDSFLQVLGITSQYPLPISWLWFSTPLKYWSIVCYRKGTTTHRFWLRWNLATVHVLCVHNNFFHLTCNVFLKISSEQLKWLLIFCRHVYDAKWDLSNSLMLKFLISLRNFQVGWYLQA